VGEKERPPVGGWGEKNEKGGADSRKGGGPPRGGGGLVEVLTTPPCKILMLRNAHMPDDSSD